MRRAIAIAAVVGACGPAEAPPPPTIVYVAAASLAPAPPATARLGVGAPRAPVASTPIVAGPDGPTTPLVAIALVGSDDRGPAVVALSGADGDGPAIDLIDVDAGVVRWRSRAAGVPAVAIVGDLVFAAGAGRVVALDRATGVERGRVDATWLRTGPAAGPALALVATAAGVALFDGARLGRTVAVPEGASADDVVAVCDVGARFVLAWRAGQLARWDLDAADAVVRWTTAVPTVARVACAAAPLIVVGGGAVRALTVDGEVIGAARAADDAWVDPRAGDRVELATALGVEARSRDLRTAHGLVPIAVARLVAARGARRLAVDRAGAWVLLDGDGAQVLAAPGAGAAVVVGDRALVAGPGAPGEVAALTRYLLPAAAAVAAAALAPEVVELLPPRTRVDLPAAPAVVDAIIGDPHVDDVVAVAFDPLDGERLYALVRDDHPTLPRGAGLAAYDLHAERWRWIERGACPPGAVVAMAVTSAVVACAARGPGADGGAVQAVTASGGARAWRWGGATVDGLVAGGSVVAILSGAEVVVVDAATGLGLTRWRASDGAVARLAIATRGADTRIASYEHGAVVVRSRAVGWLPIAATAVDGAVAAVFAYGDRFAVALADGSLYLVGDDGAATAAGAIAAGWLPRGDQAVVTRSDEQGGAVVAVDARGVPRVSAAVAARVVGVGARANLAEAPLALVTAADEVIVLDGAGAAVARAPVPAAAAAWTTVIDGRPAAGAVLAGPLRVVRLAWP
ncbi:MAG: hypothetical protein IPL61_33405 [Myxococcales bacterium]|nr:hypothetical protein [Myxococcales bacterium]